MMQRELKDQEQYYSSAVKGYDSSSAAKVELSAVMQLLHSYSSTKDLALPTTVMKAMKMH
jgi:hypothetical protein